MDKDEPQQRQDVARQQLVARIVDPHEQQGSAEDGVTEAEGVEDVDARVDARMRAETLQDLVAERGGQGGTEDRVLRRRLERRHGWIQQPADQDGRRHREQQRAEDLHPAVGEDLAHRGRRGETATGRTQAKSGLQDAVRTAGHAIQADAARNGSGVSQTSSPPTLKVDD